MESTRLDDVDRGILYLLQHDARRIATQEMGDRVGVSASTVRNRIEKMEEDGVIRGYLPQIDYDRAGLQLHVLFICSSPGPERDRLAKRARDVEGVVTVQEVLNGDDNIQIEAVGTDTDDVARISDRFEQIGLKVTNSKILKGTHRQPFDHFGEDVVDE